MRTVSTKDVQGSCRRALIAICSASVLTLSACSAGEDTASPSASEDAGVAVVQPIAITYDGGIALLNGETLELASKVERRGFLRVNPAGDDSHVMVSDEAGFSVLNASQAKLTDISFPGAKPGHVVLHGGKTVLFVDSTGDALSFDPNELAEGKPKVRTYESDSPHHGVAVELADGTIVASVGDEENRSGARAVNAEGKEIARSNECPGIHGEAVAADEIVGFGCHDGVLLFKDGAFVKVPAADEYGATATQVGSEASPVLLGDYKTDPDAEREFPTQFALVDTASQKQSIVQMPGRASYSFRSLGRGPRNCQDLWIGVFQATSVPAC